MNTRTQTGMSLCSFMIAMSAIAGHLPHKANTTLGTHTYPLYTLIKDKAQSFKKSSAREVLINLEDENGHEAALYTKLFAQLQTTAGWQALTSNLSQTELIKTHNRCRDIIARLRTIPPPNDTEKQIIDWKKIEGNKKLFVDLLISIKKHIEVEWSPPSFWRAHRTLFGTIAVAAISCIAYWLYTSRRTAADDEHSIEQAQEAADD